MAHKRDKALPATVAIHPDKHVASRFSRASRWCRGASWFARSAPRVHPGRGTGMGKDFTIFAVMEGKVEYQKKAGDRVFVHVVAPKATASA